MLFPVIYPSDKGWYAATLTRGAWRAGYFCGFLAERAYFNKLSDLLKLLLDVNPQAQICIDNKDGLITKENF